MKKLTETQKKWALTACLATVLSFNFLMGLSGSTYSTASFASTADEDESVEVDDVEVDAEDEEIAEPKFAPIITENGKLRVKYIKEDDGSTTAIVPKKVASGFCWEDCGKPYLLPKNFNSSKDDLEVALRKAMKKEDFKVALAEREELSDDELEQVVSKKAKKLKKRLRDQDEDDEEEIEEDKDLLALEKKCEPKEDDTRMECFSSGLTKLLKNKKTDHEKELVLALYKKEIEPGLLDSLTDARDYDRRENGQAILEDMLASVSKKYNYLRERMVKLAASTVKYMQIEAQKRLRQAEQLKSTRPGQALLLQNEGYYRRSMAENMAMNLDYTLQSGLESAQFSHLIKENQVVDLYTTRYADVVNPIIQGMQQNPLTYVISSPLTDGNLYADDGNGNLISIGASSGPIGQLRSSGRGITIHGNGLTPANVANSGTPRIITLDGINAGTATIQVIPASQVPTNFNQVVAPGTNVIGIRGRQ